MINEFQNGTKILYMIMNEISVVCFTCKRDEALLPLHYNAIRRVTDSPVYYFVDEAEIDTMTFPKGSQPFATDFVRNGNLIGLDALKGLIASYSYLNTDILKVDTDTVLLSTDWIERTAAMQGFSPSKSFSIHGSCYYLSKDTVSRIKHFIENYYQDYSNNRCEDQVITSIASIVSEPYKVLIQSPITEETVNSCVFTSNFYNIHDAIKEVRCSINCGDSAYLEPYEAAGLDRTIQVKRAMEFVLSKYYK